MVSTFKRKAENLSSAGFTCSDRHSSTTGVFKRLPMSLALRHYRKQIALDEPFSAEKILSEADFNAALAELTGFLADEEGGILPSPDWPGIADLRAMLTRRGPEPLPVKYLRLSDALLQTLKSRRVITKALELPAIADTLKTSSYPEAGVCKLWLGDITGLEVDGIVNAANEKMLGCFIPFHACIDNAIHWQAGPRLRADCETIMQAQHLSDEETGSAKITRGYNLPARYVLHTVGPVVRGPLTAEHHEQLSSCYQSCLHLASQAGLRSLAFCAISTGVYGFPHRPAARTALETVARWLSEHPGRFDHIIFNVFSADHERIYQECLEAYQ
ncbi:protein-ADP-ribose hydrolase [Erwinia amylovora]